MEQFQGFYQERLLDRRSGRPNPRKMCVVVAGAKGIGNRVDGGHLPRYRESDSRIVVSVPCDVEECETKDPPFHIHADLWAPEVPPDNKVLDSRQEESEVDIPRCSEYCIDLLGAQSRNHRDPFDPP